VNIVVFSLPLFSSIEAMAEHVIASVSGPFALAGHSMGGRVALGILRRTPARVTGLALLNTGIHAPAPHEPQSRGRLVALGREQGMAAVAREWLPPMMAGSSSGRGEVLGRT